MVQITDKAVEEIKKIMTEEGDNSLLLRIGVQGGGCSGLSYFLNLDKEARPVDKNITINTIPVLIDSKSMLYLDGTVIDYTDGLNGKGFVFENPNAQRTCGCGSSFSV